MEVRPKSPPVLGVLAIIFGSLVVVLTLIGQTMSAYSADLKTLGVSAEIFAQFEAALEPWNWIFTAIMALMSAVHIFIGIGLRNYRAWARKATVLWSGIGIVVVLGMMVHHYLVTVPATEALLETVPRDVAGIMSTSIEVGGALSAFLYLPWPIILWVFMSKPRIVAAMQS